MPYIKLIDREKYDNKIDELLTSMRNATDGDLNYIITRLCIGFIADKTKNYSTLNTVIGVLECAQLELYRRVVSLYEDNKIIENGDVS